MYQTLSTYTVNTATSAASARRLHNHHEGLGLNIRKAIDQSIRYKRAGSDHKSVQQGLGKRISEWFETEYQVTEWHDIMPFMVQSLVNQLLADGRKANYVRQWGKVLTGAGEFVKDNYPNEWKELPIGKYMPKAERPPKRFLTFEQWAQAVTAAKKKGSRAALLGFLVGGLTGLRLQELVRLRKTDLIGDCIFVHDSKTAGSTRLIPVCAIVRQLLERELGSGPLYSDYTAISHKMKPILNDLATETGDPCFAMVAPKDAARKTFDNLCISLQVPFEVKEGYLGHTLPGVAGAYSAVRATPDDMPSVRAQVLTVLRDKVVASLEKQIAEINLSL